MNVENCENYQHDQCDCLTECSLEAKEKVIQEDEKNGMYEQSQGDDEYEVWVEFGNEVNKLLERLPGPFGIHPALDFIRLRKQFTITKTIK